MYTFTATIRGESRGGGGGGGGGGVLCFYSEATNKYET